MKRLMILLVLALGLIFGFYGDAWSGAPPSPPPDYCQAIILPEVPPICKNLLPQPKSSPFVRGVFTVGLVKYLDCEYYVVHLRLSWGEKVKLYSLPFKLFEWGTPANVICSPNWQPNDLLYELLNNPLIFTERLCSVWVADADSMGGVPVIVDASGIKEYNCGGPINEMLSGEVLIRIVPVN